MFKQHQQREQVCFIAHPAGIIVVRLPGAICHSPDKYLTPACNAHMEEPPSVRHCSYSADRPAQLAALLLSPLVRNYSD